MNSIMQFANSDLDHLDENYENPENIIVRYPYLV
jgi:hypothetical protein